jgi:hypothetical protein
MSNKKEKAKWELILIKVTVVSIIIEAISNVLTTIINLFK